MGPKAGPEKGATTKIETALPRVLASNMSPKMDPAFVSGQAAATPLRNRKARTAPVLGAKAEPI